MASIKVNAGQWNAISENERQSIIDGLRETGAIKAEDTVIPDQDEPPFTEETVLEPMWNPIKDVAKGACKALCDATAAAAVAWCTANTAGVGLVACLALAESARKECRKRC